MAYRDADELALRTALDERLSSAALDDPERVAITERLATIDRARRDRARRHLPLVARARIATPCGERFETMLGNGAIRTCARCDREVVDVARMTLGEAEALLASRCGDLCARLHLRADGTMLFADCEVGVRRVRDRRLTLAATAVAIAGAALISNVEPDARYVAPGPTYAHGPFVTLPTARQRAWHDAVLEGEIADTSAIDDLLRDHVVMGEPEW